MNWFASLALAPGMALISPSVGAQPVAQAQARAGVQAGAMVYDAQQAEVGKIESVANGNAVVFTGTHRATIPLASFGIGPKGPTLGMTRAELDAAAVGAAAAATEQLRARLTPGTQVRGKAGAVIATVKTLEGDNVVLSTGNSEVRVPLSGMGLNTQGVFIGMTQAEFDAAVAANATTGQ